MSELICPECAREGGHIGPCMRKWYFEKQLADGTYSQDGRKFDTREDALQSLFPLSPAQHAVAYGYRKITLGLQGKGVKRPTYEVLYEQS